MGWGPDAPDTSGVNAAAVQNAAISKEQLDFARDQATKAETRQAAFDPKFSALIDQAIGSQKTADDRSAEQWQQYLNIGMPAENRLAETAANYDTQGRRDEAAAEARAGIESQAGMARTAQNRDLGRAGISLSSGRALTLDNASRLAQTKVEAGAAQAARDKVEATGMSLTDNVAKMGRGMTSTGLQAAQLALGAGGTASGTLGAQQSTYGASLAPAMSGYSSAVGSNTAAGNLYGNVAQLQSSASGGALQGLMGLGQLAGQGYMMYQGSSRKLKKNKRPMKSLADKALAGIRKLPDVEAWDYKDGVADEGRHIGEYAEDAQANFGDKLAPHGAMLNMVETSKRNKRAIAALANELDKFEAVLTKLEASA